MAKLNVTYRGGNGDLPEGVDYDIPDATILQIAKESIQDGHIPGIEADPIVSLDGFEVVRFPADDGSNLGDRIFVRPKTPFGC